MFPAKTILHPTDFSERSDAAFRVACSLARDSGARLIVVHVLPPPVAYGEVIARRGPDGYLEQLWKQLDGYRDPAGVVCVEHWLEEGKVVDEVLFVAEETDSDLIVLGTHGRTGVRRLLMGSVAEEVVRRARCPVLTVSAPVPEEVPARCERAATAP